MPLFQQKEKRNIAFLQAVRTTVQGAYICYKRETLSLCIFVKQPIANGQEVFPKVLQIYIMFLRTGVCIRITDLTERRKAGAFVQPHSSLLAMYLRRIKITSLAS